MDIWISSSGERSVVKHPKYELSVVQIRGTD